MANASRDGNFIATLMAVSTVDGKTPIPVKVDPSGNLQTSATLSGGGGDGAILDGAASTIKATVFSLVGSNPLTTAIVDGSGNQITSFGGGTQYADGTTQATPTGTAALGKNASNVLHALSLDSSGNLNVNLAAGSISGGNAAASATGSAVPSSADYLGLKDGSGNLVGVTIGQQLAASSIPVILPSATITTLTPPPAITNFANETGGNLATLAGIVSSAKAATKMADGDLATLGLKADTASTATDTTAVTIMAVLKQISKMAQAPASTPVTGTFWQSTQPVSIASMPSTPVTGTFWQATQPVSVADGSDVTFGAKADAKNAATDTTAVSAMSVLKQISASVQAPPSQAVTNAGTFAVQATPVTQADTFMLGGVNIKEINAVTPLMGNGATGTGSQRVTIASDNSPVAGLGAGATGSAVPANASYLGVKDGLGNLVGLAVTSQLGDSGNNTLGVGMYVYDGSGEVRARSVVNATNSTGSGIPAAGLIAQLDDVSPTTITENQFGNLRMTTERALNVSLKPDTTGGWSKIKYAAQTTTVQTPKGTAGTFGGYFVYNPNSTVAYVQVFDAATATTITLGTTVPDMIFGIPATSGANLELSNGVNMANGIKLAVTTTATGLTAPGTGVDMTIFYK